MWKRSASFIKPADRAGAPSDMTELRQPPVSSAYYQTRAEHDSVTSDWLAHAQVATSSDRTQPIRQIELPQGDGVSSLGATTFSVIEEFNYRRKKPDLAEAVAAIMALASVIRSSKATTMMELEIELEKAVDSRKSWDTTSISLTAASDLFMRYVTRTTALEIDDFDAAKCRLIERGEKFEEIYLKISHFFIVTSSTAYV